MSEVPAHMTLGQILPPGGLCAAHARLEDESESGNESEGDELGSDYDDERPLLPHEKLVFVRESGDGYVEGGEGIRGVSLDGVEDLNREERLVALIGREGVFVTNKNKNAKFGEGGGKGKFNRGVAIDEFGLVVVGEDEEADNGVPITDTETGAEVVSEDESENGDEESDDDEGGVPLTPPPSPGAEHEDAPCSLQPKSLVPYKLKGIPKGEAFPEYGMLRSSSFLTHFFCFSPSNDYSVSYS
jgi:hypothetical protein